MCYSLRFLVPLILLALLATPQWGWRNAPTAI